MPANLTCNTCDHFCAVEQECREAPPNLFPRQTPQGLAFSGVWPPSRPNLWCGKHSKYRTRSLEVVS